MTTLLSPPPLPGDSVSKYLLQETLGIGGNATVYRAEHPDLGEVALTTRVRPRTIEAIFDSSTLDLGEQPLRLVDVQSGQAILLGNLRP